MKLRHLIISLCLLVIILRWEIVLNSFLMIVEIFILLFNEPALLKAHISFSLIDVILSSVIIISLPVFLFIGKYLLDIKIDFANITLTILLFFFVFAPLISTAHPDFHKEIGMTKLLSPLSSIKILYKKSEAAEHRQNNFLQKKNKILKQPFDESLLFAEKVNLKKNIYYKKGSAYSINKNEFIYEENNLKVETKYFLLGTDELGRDIFSRLVYGARVSLFIGLGGVIVSFLLGISLGFAAGFPGGFIDSFLNRLTDMLLAFPVIFLIILFLALFGNSIFIIIIVLGFSGWMSLFKIVRGEVLSIKQKDFFITAKMLGVPGSKLLLKEILPLILAPVIINLVLQYGNVILAESALSFLGLGAGREYPSWGSMIEQGQRYLTRAWWMIFFPGAALFITLLAANSFGKKINDIYNPRSG